jgi:hypothetical protein
MANQREVDESINMKLIDTKLMDMELIVSALRRLLLDAKLHSPTEGWLQL